MRMIISPAKKMRKETDSFACRDFPQFLPQTRQIMEQLRKMSFDELRALWKCSDKIAEENYARISEMDIERCQTPAILSYDGIQYRYMAPAVFTAEELEYIAEHLRILSGFYGLLRPFDAVTPYRLEMQARLRIEEKKNLYEFWGDSLAKALFSETDCIVNLASKEYGRCIERYVPKGVRFITCTFGEKENGKVIERATSCKMARGAMVRYMAQNKIETPEALKAFSEFSYYFSPEHSDPLHYTFLQKWGGKVRNICLRNTGLV